MRSRVGGSAIDRDSSAGSCNSGVRRRRRAYSPEPDVRAEAGGDLARDVCTRPARALPAKLTNPRRREAGARSRQII